MSANVIKPLPSYCRLETLPPALERYRTLQRSFTADSESLGETRAGLQQIKKHPYADRIFGLFCAVISIGFLAGGSYLMYWGVTHAMPLDARKIVYLALAGVAVLEGAAIFAWIAHKMFTYGSFLKKEERENVAKIGRTVDELSGMKQDHESALRSLQASASSADQGVACNAEITMKALQEQTPFFQG